MGPLGRNMNAATDGRAEGVVVQQQHAGQRHHHGAEQETPRRGAAGAGGPVVHSRRSPPDRPPAAVPPSSTELGDLVTTLRTLHLERQQVQAYGAATRRPRPKPVRCCSDRTFHHCTRGGGKRADECGSLSHNLASGLPRHPGDGSSSDSDGEDSEGLGAPPLLPPTLKRARACSFSPTSSTARDFSKKRSFTPSKNNPPHQQRQ
eukprot:g7417.t1